MNTDSNVNDLVNRAVATIEPRTDLLIAGGLARGRALRRRRRITQGASGVALAGLIAAVAVAVWPSSSTPGAQHTNAQHTNQAAASSPTSVASVAHEAPPARATITPQVVAQRAIDLLPAGATVTNLSGNSLEGSVGAELTYDDGHGAALLEASVDFGPTSSGLGGACEISTCTTGPDGSKLAVRQGSDNPSQPNAEPKEWTVILQRTDGVTVTISEWNAPAEKGAAPTTRAVPPLSIAAAKAFARSNTWRSKVPQSEIDADAGLFTPDQ
jgi:hypothetical protein